MSTYRILVALATYNEIDNLPGLVDAIHSELPDADLLVVDDNSPDGTGRWCDDHAATYSWMTCLHRPGKQGLGSATMVAIHWALAHEYDVVVTMDADWSHDPQYLPALVEATERADVAIGSRYCAGGSIEGWPVYRRVVSRMMNGLSRLMLRLPVRDSSGAFRAYRAAALRAAALEDVQSAGYSYLEEILWQLRRACATFEEVPITFRERRAGKSKVSVGEAVAKLRVLWTLSRRKT